MATQDVDKSAGCERLMRVLETLRRENGARVIVSADVAGDGECVVYSVSVDRRRVAEWRNTATDSVAESVAVNVQIALERPTCIANAASKCRLANERLRVEGCTAEEWKLANLEGRKIEAAKSVIARTGCSTRAAIASIGVVACVCQGGV